LQVEGESCADTGREPFDAAASYLFNCRCQEMRVKRSPASPQASPALARGVSETIRHGSRGALKVESRAGPRLFAHRERRRGSKRRPLFHAIAGRGGKRSLCRRRCNQETRLRLRVLLAMLDGIDAFAGLSR
jgi:hypothetical protein